MGWIKKWQEKRKENREYIIELEWRDTQEKIDRAGDELKSFRKAMFNLNCPFNDEKCHNGCVHFMPGSTYKLPDVYGGTFVGYNLPKCLLWNKK